MAIGKFHGVMMPTTPTGSRVISTPTPGRTLGTVSPASRSASPAKKSKIWAARTVSPMPSAKRLAFLARQQPAEFVLARQDLVGRLAQHRVALQRCRSATIWGRPPWPRRSPLRVVGLVARAYSPTTSLVSDGLMLGDGVAADPFAVDQVLVQASHLKNPFVFRAQVAEARLNG